MQLDYLEIKKKFMHAPMDLKSRSHIFKPFDALEGYHEELRRGAGEGGGLEGLGVAGKGGIGVNRGVAERAGSRRRQKMGVEVQFGGGAEYGFCRNFVNLFGNALR